MIAGRLHACSPWQIFSVSRSSFCESLGLSLLHHSGASISQAHQIYPSGPVGTLRNEGFSRLLSGITIATFYLAPIFSLLTGAERTWRRQNRFQQCVRYQ